MVVCQCQSCKVGELFGSIDIVNSYSYRHLKSWRRDSVLVTLTQFKMNRMMHKGVQTGYDMERRYKKGNQWSLIVQHFDLGTY